MGYAARRSSFQEALSGEVSDAAPCFLSCEIRDWTRAAHRHRGLLEALDRGAEGARGQLAEIVLAASQVAKSINEQLIWLVTGDGMALVSRNGSEELVNCKWETCRALQK
jgi:hypothetical protein